MPHDIRQLSFPSRTETSTLPKSNITAAHKTSIAPSIPPLASLNTQTLPHPHSPTTILLLCRTTPTKTLSPHPHLAAILPT